MNSCIYRGRVLHRRIQPAPHEFTYNLFMLYLDLSELDQVFRGRWFWSTRGPNVAWFRRREHLGDRNLSLDSSVRELIEQRTGKVHSGPIRMLTHLRYFGFQMNPVSFFFCFDNDEQLKHVVAEVNNTPWGEQHCYLLDPGHFSTDHPSQRITVPKEFHVSPFMPMDMYYRWRMAAPDENLNIGISNFRDNRKQLVVAMSMTRQPITPANLRNVLIRYPLMTGQVFAAIYWQAFRLWRKRIPFFAHPARQVAESTSTESAIQSESMNV